MQEKHDRILAAAAALFDERGYDNVTTSELATAADVGTGSLFRLGGTKAELLLQIMNSRFRQLPAPKLSETLTQEVQRLMSPILTLALNNPENFAAYEREVMFGPLDSDYRRAAVEGIAHIETQIGAALRADLGQLPSGLTEHSAGRIFLSTIYIELIRLGLGGATREDVEAGIEERLGIIRDGLAARL